MRKIVGICGAHIKPYPRVTPGQVSNWHPAHDLGVPSETMRRPAVPRFLIPLRRTRFNLFNHSVKSFFVPVVFSFCLLRGLDYSMMLRQRKTFSVKIIYLFACAI
jgi:hypothetical protein